MLTTRTQSNIRTGKKRTPASKKNQTSEASPRQQTDATYDSIRARRYHGAGNHRGVCYHALYACAEVFRLYEGGGPTAAISEHLEDFDLYGDDFGWCHTQIKNETLPLTMTKLGKVLKSFAEALRVNAEAKFRVVSVSGYPEVLDRFLSGSTRKEDTAALRELAKKACGDRELGDLLLRNTQLLQISEEELIRQTEACAIRHWGVSTDNVEVYAYALFRQLIPAAGMRREITKEDLESLRNQVWELLARGPENIAVRDGLITPVTFERESRIDDYYEGVSARADHIAGGADVRRARELGAISSALHEADVCAILASSGQGKSTLAYRQAYETSGAYATFLLRACETASQATSIAEFINVQLRTGLPITILVDNLSSHLRKWSLVVQQLAGKGVKFIVTSREEDWYRYGHQTAGFSWRPVRLHLTLDEAKSIYFGLRDKNLVAPNVLSAEWAYEKIKDAGLLIEFVYLVTEGRSLEERLKEQVRTIKEEDKGKIHALRLISVADTYRAPIKAEVLLRTVPFDDDGPMGLESLEREYIVANDGYLVGLHPVRSKRLAHLLHPHGWADTVKTLCGLVDSDQLPTLIRNAFVDLPTVGQDITETLADRCVAAEPDLFGRIWQSCLEAEEHRYLQDNQAVFDLSMTSHGNSGHTMLTFFTLPASPVQVEEWREVMGDEFVDEFSGYLRNMKPRTAGQRTDTKLTESVTSRCVSRGDLLSSVRLSDLLYGVWAGNLQNEETKQLLSEANWGKVIWTCDPDDLSQLCIALQRLVPEQYKAWLDENRARLQSHLKLLTNSLDVRQEQSEIVVRFHVDCSADAPDPSDQATERGRVVSAVFSDAESFRTETVYPLGDDALSPFDGAYKHGPRSTWIATADVKLNKAWREAVDSLSLADGLWIWQDEHLDLLKAGRSYFEFLLKQLKEQAAGHVIRSETKAGAQFMAHFLNQRAGRLRKLPERLAQEDRDLLTKPAQMWASMLAVVIRQGMEHLLEPTDEKTLRLLRINLRSLYLLIDPMLKAVNTAQRWAGMDEHKFNPKSEALVYLQLIQALEYFAAGVSGSVDLSVSGRRWFIERDQNLLRRIADAIESLAPEALNQVLLPTVVLDDLPGAELSQVPQRSIVIGFQVQDFSELDNHVLELLGLCAEAIPEFDGYLLCVPLYGSVRFGHHAIRAWCSSLVALMSGDPPIERFVFPVEVPSPPSVDFVNYPAWVPRELALVEALAEPARKMGMATAALREGERALDVAQPEEARYLDRLRKDHLYHLGSQSPLRLALKEVSDFRPQTGVESLWRDVADEAEHYSTRVNEAPGDFLAAWLNVNNALVKYLGAAYPCKS